MQYGGGAGSFLLNIIWLDCIRSASCTGASGVGYSFMCDDYRNPFGLQQFKLAKLALMPFGAEVY